MTITLLHTSDWHIGKPFGRFEDSVAGVLRHARLAAIDRLAAAARDFGARIVLVAGDVFDSPRLADRDLRAPLAQMAAHPDLCWHIIPGNHDPAVPGGVWDRVRRLGLPRNVVLHLEAKAVEIAPQTWLLPAPLSAKSMVSDPTAWMDQAVTPAGGIRLGLAHGSVQGFGSEKRASIEIAPDRANRAGLGYLALGDWHGLRQIGTRAAYSGTPEPDDYLDNAPGFALQVEIEGAGAVPRITRREIGAHRWIKREIEGSRTGDLAALEAEIEAMAAGARQVLLAVELVGRVTMSEEHALRGRLDALDGKVMRLERRFDRLTPAPDIDDVEKLTEGSLRDLTRDLSRLAVEADEGQRAVASRAVRYLFELAGEVGQPAEGSR